MSAFLGPIHYWLYNKIMLQQNLIDKIVALGDKETPDLDLKNKMDSLYGVSETRPLEAAIDHGNIHAWLQSNVSRAEYKLAYSTTQLLNTKPALAESIAAIFYNQGTQTYATLSIENNAAALFKGISDSLLDGMPCDHANLLVESDENKAVWKRNVCVHQSYWDEVGGDINNYYHFRETWIHGFLNQTAFCFKKADSVTYRIVRRDENESK